MTLDRWPFRNLPDVVDEGTSPILCPTCLAPTHFALNTNRYVCATHGPVITDEFVARELPDGSPS